MQNESQAKIEKSPEPKVLESKLSKLSQMVSMADTELKKTVMKRRKSANTIMNDFYLKHR